MTGTFWRAASLAALFLCAGWDMRLPAAHAQPGGPPSAASEAAPDASSDASSDISGSVQVLEVLPPEAGPAVRYVAGKLTVQAHETPFGDIISLIASEADFEVAISPGIANKVVSTSFKTVDLEKAILRLFSLISHRNYYIHYRPDNSIAKIEIYDIQQSPAKGNQTLQGISGPGAPARPPSGPRRTGIARPDGAPLVTTPGKRPAIDTNPSATTTITGQGKGAPPAPPVPRIGSITPPTSRPRPEDFNDTEAPLIAPEQTPEYIPPARKVD